MYTELRKKQGCVPVGYVQPLIGGGLPHVEHMVGSSVSWPGGSAYTKWHCGRQSPPVNREKPVETSSSSKLLFIYPQRPQHKDIYKRKIENIQHAPIFKVNLWLKVHNAPL